MFTKNQFFFFFFLLFLKLSASSDDDFIFNGFSGANLNREGVASITSDGLLQLTNRTQNKKGYGFYPSPLQFKSSSGKVLSFSSTFVFGILPEVPYLGGNGIVFVISKTTDFSDATASQFFGLFNDRNNGNATNHVFGVELDTVLNPEFQDINNNHVGIDINSLDSYNSTSAGYYDDSSGSFQNLTLISNKEMQVWVDFDGEKNELNVTLSPIGMTKPKKPLLSSIVDLSSLMLDEMYVGFSSTNGGFHTSHYVLGWSFKMNGEARALDYTKLPKLPVISTKGISKAFAIWLPISVVLFILLIISAIVMIRRRRKFAELLEDWELQYGPHRFSYKDLYKSTKGFKEKELLGAGGFGKVYKGVLPNSKLEVAVKKVSHESRQGMKQFVAEIVSIGQLRHRNLVQLLGYCRRRGELLLVYDFMPNGSLDKFLYDGAQPTLNWAQRFRIIKGVASGLLYLHEDWEQVVVHRDIKASNVLLDSELNGRLGDFGLARLYDHGTDPQTTHIVGTMGYLAPELSRTGKATTATDVFAFGAFLLEVVCGRRPVELNLDLEEQLLIGWVLMSWQRGHILETRDVSLGDEYCDYEVELVLKLGLLCSNPMAAARPSMRQVVQYLEGDLALPELPAGYVSCATPSPSEGFDKSFCSSVSSLSSLSGGR
ncbi:L-type lectin-domain containing receptor kinase IV.1-like isoform X2 [Asparagus officinalis]|uniref:L-type lectin-domain containing receptor kinase IV.1-like isoform X1 n=1 Tax=Asparagus officinalis TaxID=4686 RepID=UPI00098DF62E|nr:L-type lectin-domain containing receptor kinase IV.1-like isoform X1 [Asparagus officinalis]XP_020256336.1 L-type lectin-domain containing receptor kinase IV.1-like isoform X2 [Asparagus officinalis]